MTLAEYHDIETVRSLVTMVNIRDGRVFEAKTGVQFRTLVRAFHKGAWAYSGASGAADPRALVNEASRNAVKLSKGCPQYDLSGYRPGKPHIQQAKLDPESFSIEEKTKRLLELEGLARIKSNIKTVLNYSDHTTAVEFRSSDGRRLSQTLVNCGVSLSCVAREGDVIQSMFESERKSGGWEVVDRLGEGFSKKTAERALRLLDAKHAPGGPSTVVLDPRLVGTFVHEALGHMAEGDGVAEHDSVLEGKLNSKIASALVSVVDDKTLKSGYGTFGFDRDGAACEKTFIIKDGVLSSFLNSRDSGGKLGQASTGNCRGAFNQVRMSNTVLLGGDWGKDEIIRNTKKGIYLIGSSGGTAQSIDGYFNFGALEGYVIKNGELTKHLRDVSMLGNTLEALLNVDALAGDVEVDSGTCGKNGEWIPVGLGGPHTRTRAVIGGSV